MSLPTLSSPELSQALQQHAGRIDEFSHKISQFSEDVRKLEAYYVSKGVCIPYRIEVQPTTSGVLFQPGERHFLTWERQDDKDYRIFHEVTWIGGQQKELLANTKSEVRAALRAELPNFIAGIASNYK